LIHAPWPWLSDKGSGDYTEGNIPGMEKAPRRNARKVVVRKQLVYQTSIAINSNPLLIMAPLFLLLPNQIRFSLLACYSEEQ
jgi:hypothetical protein